MPQKKLSASAMATKVARPGRGPGRPPGIHRPKRSVVMDQEIWDAVDAISVQDQSRNTTYSKVIESLLRGLLLPSQE